MSEFVTVARVEDIPNHRGLTVRVQGRQIAVFKVDDDYFAMEGRCPHKGAPLSEGTIAEGTVFCPLHAWQFDLKTGACLDRPDRPVQTFPVRVIEGEVQIEV